MPAVAEMVVLTMELYLLVGMLVAVAFVVFGVSRVDAAARGASWGFRAILLPGSTLLWPLVLRRWAARRRPTENQP